LNFRGNVPLLKPLGTRSNTIVLLYEDGSIVLNIEENLKTLSIKTFKNLEFVIPEWKVTIALSNKMDLNFARMSF